MTRSTGMNTLLSGFVRGGAWGAAVGLLVVVVVVAPLLLR
jgi:hypothetical protein